MQKDSSEPPEVPRHKKAKDTISNCLLLIRSQTEKEILLSQLKVKYLEKFGEKIELFGLSLSAFFRKYGRGKIETFLSNGNSGAASIRIPVDTKNRNVPHAKSSSKSNENDSVKHHVDAGKKEETSSSKLKKTNAPRKQAPSSKQNGKLDEMPALKPPKNPTNRKPKVKSTARPKNNIKKESNIEGSLPMSSSSVDDGNTPEMHNAAPHSTVSPLPEEKPRSLKDDQLRKIETELGKGSAALVFTDSEGRCNVLRVKSFEVSRAEKLPSEPSESQPSDLGRKEPPNVFAPSSLPNLEIDTTSRERTSSSSIGSVRQLSSIDSDEVIDTSHESDSGWSQHFKEYIRFYRSWVEPISNEDGCIYFMDRRKRYPHKTNSVGYQILQKLMDRNEKVLAVNHAVIEEKSPNPFKTASEGERLYVQWKNMLAKGRESKWSDRDSAHPGFQRMYLHLKSIQALAETWTMLERIDASGLFIKLAQDTPKKVHVLNLFGGPSYELFAMEQYFAKFFPKVQLNMVAIDCTTTWEAYVKELGYHFHVWNADTEDILSLVGIDENAEEPVYLNLSYAQVNSMSIEMLNLLRNLLVQSKVHAMFITDHDLIQANFCQSMEESGIQVERLLHQSKCRDDRQLLLLNKSTLSIGSFPELDRPKSYTTVFPNVPYAAVERVKLMEQRTSSKYRMTQPQPDRGDPMIPPRSPPANQPRPNLPPPPNFVRSGEWVASFQEFVTFYQSWLHALSPEGNCVFFSDQEKVLPHNTNIAGYSLLLGMMSVTKKALQVNHSWIGSLEHPWEVAAEGEALFRERQRSRQRFVSPGQILSEASHPGFQRMFLHIKSFQCFTETWSLLERAKAVGVFDNFVVNKPHLVRFATIFGGPAFEILAAKMFFSTYFPGIELEMVSMDPCGVWREYAEAMGCRFECWDVNEGFVLERCKFGDGRPPYFMTYLLIPQSSVYCETDRTMDMFHGLLTQNRVQAILVNDKSMLRPQFSKMMEDRGLGTVKLLDQSIRQDDRMMVFVSPETHNALKLENLRNLKPIFPDVPYAIDERPCVNLIQTGWCQHGDGCWHSHNIQKSSMSPRYGMSRAGSFQRSGPPPPLPPHGMTRTSSFPTLNRTNSKRNMNWW